MRLGLSGTRNKTFFASLPRALYQRSGQILFADEVAGKQALCLLVRRSSCEGEGTRESANFCFFMHSVNYLPCATRPDVAGRLDDMRTNALLFQVFRFYFGGPYHIPLVADSPVQLAGHFCLETLAETSRDSSSMISHRRLGRDMLGITPVSLQFLRWSVVYEFTCRVLLVRKTGKRTSVPSSSLQMHSASEQQTWFQSS
jgi:hypothetical protein